MKNGKLTLEPALAQCLLEELIFQHVCAQVDLFKLGCFEDELDEAIRHVLDGLDTGGDDPPPSVLAASLIDRAWSRLEAEWREYRGGATACPSCALQVPA